MTVAAPSLPESVWERIAEGLVADSWPRTKRKRQSKPGQAHSHRRAGGNELYNADVAAVYDRSR